MRAARQSTPPQACWKCSVASSVVYLSNSMPIQSWRIGGFLNWTAAARAPAVSCFGERLCCTWPEFGIVEAARLLLDRGADVNARATVDDAGVGGQTAIFHAATQFGDQGLPMAQLLVDRGADLSVCVKLPGHYERPDEVVECTPLGYALRFQDESHSEGGTIAFLRERGALE